MLFCEVDDDESFKSIHIINFNVKKKRFNEHTFRYTLKSTFCDIDKLTSHFLVFTLFDLYGSKKKTKNLERSCTRCPVALKLYYDDRYVCVYCKKDEDLCLH